MASEACSDILSNLVCTFIVAGLGLLAGKRILMSNNHDFLLLLIYIDRLLRCDDIIGIDDSSLLVKFKLLICLLSVGEFGQICHCQEIFFFTFSIFFCQHYLSFLKFFDALLLLPNNSHRNVSNILVSDRTDNLFCLTSWALIWHFNVLYMLLPLFKKHGICLLFFIVKAFGQMIGQQNSVVIGVFYAIDG